MSKATFDALLFKVGPFLRCRKYQSTLRPEISPAERLTITLCYLATGNSQVSLYFNFRVRCSIMCHLLRETCFVMWHILCEGFVRAPNTEEEWKGISEQFARLWNFPNCVGAIDRKHVVIQAPANCGSAFYGYKGTHLIVLLAVCDAHYHFTLVDIGNAGHHGNSGVLSHSAFGQGIESECLVIRPSRALPGAGTVVPFVFVGDEVFPLRTNLIRPYP